MDAMISRPAPRARPRSAVRMLPTPAGGAQGGHRPPGGSSDLHATLGLELGHRRTNTEAQVKKYERVIRAGPGVVGDDSDSSVSSDEDEAPASSNPARRRVLAPAAASTGGGDSPHPPPC